MLIIITGCDRTGKSTLCNQLMKLIADAKYTHFSVPASKEEAKQSYFQFINDIDPKQTYIIDRFYECESVYAPIYRQYDLDYSREIEQYIRNKDRVLYLYLQSDIDVIRERIKKDGEDYVQNDDLEKVISNYQLFMKQLHLPYLMLTNNNSDDMILNLHIIQVALSRINKVDKLAYGNMQARLALIDKHHLTNLTNETNLNADFFEQCFEETIELKELDNDEISIDKILKSYSTNYNDYWFTPDISDLEVLGLNDALIKL